MLSPFSSSGNQRTFLKADDKSALKFQVRYFGSGQCPPSPGSRNRFPEGQWEPGCQASTTRRELGPFLQAAS